MKSVGLGVVLFVTASAMARAEEPEETPPSPTIPEAAPKPVQHKPRPFASEPEPEPPKKAHVSIEWLPLRLLVPVGAIAAEVRLHDRVSVTVSFGAGAAQVKKAGDIDGRATAVQAGFAAQWYVGGTFEDGGIHLGAAALYTRVGDASMRMRTSLVRPGALAGPLVGFKYVLPAGFTFDSQLGIGINFGSGGAAPVDTDQPTSLMGDVGIGWTF